MVIVRQKDDILKYLFFSFDEALEKEALSCVNEREIPTLVLPLIFNNTSPIEV